MSRTPFHNTSTSSQDVTTTTGHNNPSGNNYRALRDYGATAATISSSSGGTGNNQQHPAGAAMGATSTSQTSLISSSGLGPYSSPPLHPVRQPMPDVRFAGFSPTEFMSLSEAITQNVGLVRSSLHSLESAVRKLGTHSDSQRLRARLDTEQSATNRRVETCTADLKRLNEVVRHGDKQQKLNVSRLTSDFGSIVEAYSKCQKEIALKQRMNPLANTASASASNSDDSASGGGGYQNDTSSAQQQQQQQRETLEFERSLLLEREERMTGIQNSVLDINAIMQQLGTMTQIQGSNIDMVESNMESTAGQVEQGLTELEKAARQQAKYRKKVMLLLLISVIIGLILTGILVSALKS